MRNIKTKIVAYEAAPGVDFDTVIDPSPSMKTDAACRYPPDQAVSSVSNSREMYVAALPARVVCSSSADCA